MAAEFIALHDGTIAEVVERFVVPERPLLGLSDADIRKLHAEDKPVPMGGGYTVTRVKVIK